ncbi:MAG TPA: TIGR04283 family arsenosugar biosynthesis glycosyltransferase [Paracoccaceae bacterium]|nr:TIGR04283 family arsenosugar biosynthesis glycosyltransferase [Paracoccaceae bacterium]
MPAPVSVIIPTLDVADRIGPCLGALAEGLDAGLLRELILADGGSTDAIEAVADAVGARLVRTARGRGQQLAAGARAARGTWLLVVHADTVLAPGWSRAVLAQIRARPGMAGYFRLRFDAAGIFPRLVAGWANLRSRLFGLPYGDQGLLIPRGLYDRVGGYPEIALMEDVAIARALRGRLCALPAWAVTSAERYRAEGWLRRGARNLGTLARYLLGTPPGLLAARYDRERRHG